MLHLEERNEDTANTSESIIEKETSVMVQDKDILENEGLAQPSDMVLNDTTEIVNNETQSPSSPHFIKESESILIETTNTLEENCPNLEKDCHVSKADQEHLPIENAEEKVEEILQLFQDVPKNN